MRQIRLGALARALPEPPCDAGPLLRHERGQNSLSVGGAGAWPSPLTLVKEPALSICAASLLALSTTMVGACGAGTRLATKSIAKQASPLIAR